MSVEQARRARKPHAMHSVCDLAGVHEHMLPCLSSGLVLLLFFVVPSSIALPVMGWGMTW